MRAPSRRKVLALLGAGGLGLAGLRWGLPRYWRAGAVRAVSELSAAAQALVAAAFDGLARERVLDLHVHLVGLGGPGPDGTPSGCWVNPRLRSRLHPLERLRFELYLGAAGVEEDEHADAAYLARLQALHAAANPGGKLLLLAFDLVVREDGSEDRAASMFHAPDAYVLALARTHPSWLACASVHPHRRDALERLEHARAGGAVAVKWLPNAMGIDPASARHAPFYAKLVELGLPLLVHTGEERAVWASDAQELGNPLRLRAPLAAGVRVVALHCASLGKARDLDAPGTPAAPAFELFLRLMDEWKESGRLYGELAAVAQVNRDARVLATLLERQDLHARLLNGSDYPLPALDPLTSLVQLAWRGFLAAADEAPLREIFAANPLLFDLVLKRCLRRASKAGELRFAPEVFESARLFDKL